MINVKQYFRGNTMRHLKIAILFIFLHFLTQNTVAQLYNFTHYSVEDGLAQNQILSIYQDSKGYIWYGTNLGGVSVFDGNTFKTISETDGLPSNVVFSIIEDDKNRMLLATNGGLGVWDGKIFTNYNKENGLGHDRVFKVFQDSKKIIWLGAGLGVCQLINDSIVKFDLDTNLSKLPVYQIYEDSKNNIWFCTIMGGVFKYDGKSIVRYTKEQGLLHNFAKSVIEDDEGNIWIGTLGGFNVLTTEGKIIERRIAYNDSILTVNSAAKDVDGTLWFGTESGLIRYKNDEFKKYNLENGINSVKILTVLVDDENNLWLGSNGKGVSKLNYHGDIFSSYSVNHGIANDIVTSIFEDSEGSMWIGSDGGITRFKDNQFKVYSKTVGVTKLGVAAEARNIIETSEGNLWIATKSTGLVSKIGDEFTNSTIEDGLISNTCYSVLKDKQGTLWLGSNKGIVTKKEGEDFQVFPELKGETIWSIHQDKKGRMWFTTDKGASLYDGSSIQYFGKKDGFVDDRVRKIVEDKQGNFWFGTNKGIFRYNGDSFTRIDDQSGLISNTIYSILITKSGMMWLGTQAGIQRIDINEFNSTGKFVTRFYSKEEGFIGVECNSNAIFEDSKGKIWFGTVQGVTIFDPELETINSKDPNTHITNLRLEFEDYDWSEFSDGEIEGLPTNLELTYKKNHLSFGFVGISYCAPEKVKYQFMLSPLDEEWLHWTAKHEAVYPHIPPGEYTFMVRAKNNDGVANTEPTTFSFVILPPWYKTWWFLTICVLSFFSAVYSVFAVRTRQLKQQKEKLEQQVTERTKELVEEKEKVEKINEEVLQKNEIIEEKNTEIMDSINYAKGIQDAILPSEEKVKKHLPNSFILFRPKDVVSGDFYWMEHKDDISFFSAADCTGHGVPGAFVSMVGVNGLNRTVNGFELREPSKMLDKLRDLVEQTFKKRKDGMDLGLCALHHKTNELHYSGANNPLWIIRPAGKNLTVDGVEIEPNLELEQNLFEVKADKQPVGSFDHAKPFTEHVVQLEDGDSIYVFTDGYPDQFGGAKGKKFMSKKLKKSLISIYHLPMKEQHDVLDKSIVEWMNVSDSEQIDDICIFGVQV
ncbi:MAG: SpoIIE family protein phosphatase [Flavobacteriales bacterium]|nr:SpoIIE family protein phosphatase [Flavobacteriales bacterium]